MHVFVLAASVLVLENLVETFTYFLIVCNKVHRNFRNTQNFGSSLCHQKELSKCSREYKRFRYSELLSSALEKETETDQNYAVFAGTKDFINEK